MSKTIIFAVGGLVAAIGVAAALFMFVLGGSSTESAEDLEPTPEPTPVVVEGRVGPHIMLEGRLYTLRGTGDEQRYVKLSLLIEFETFSEDWAHVLHGCVFVAEEGDVGPCKAEEDELNHEFEEELGTGRELIEDAVVSLISSKTYAELAEADGMEVLRTEILHAVEELIHEPSVVRVLFLEFLTQ